MTFYCHSWWIEVPAESDHFLYRRPSCGALHVIRLTKDQVTALLNDPKVDQCVSSMDIEKIELTHVLLDCDSTVGTKCLDDTFHIFDSDGCRAAS